MSNEKPVARYSLMLALVQPGTAILTVTLFSIGIGVAHYLGANPDWTGSLFMLLAVLFLIWSRNLLAAFWDHPESPLCILQPAHPRYAALQALRRNDLLTYALLCFTAAVAFVFLALLNRTPDFALLLLVGLLIAGMFFVSMPPLFLQRRGYGELVEAICVALLLPAIAMIVNYGSLNYLLEMLTVPVLFVYLAGKLAFSFRSYYEDKTYGHRNLLNRLDWERAMRLHNLLVALAYLLLALFVFLGLPWRLAWPAALTLPVAAFLILQVQGIMNGSRPNWKLLEWTAGGLIGVMSYMVLLALWLN